MKSEGYTTLSIDIPPELQQKLLARAAQEGTTLSEVVRRKLEEFATEAVQSEKLDRPVKAQKRRATPKANAAEIEASLAVLARLDELSDHLKQEWPHEVSAADALNEVRRDL